MQATIRMLSKLKPFRNPQSFHPKHLIIHANSHYQLMTLFPWNFLIDKEILQFYGRPHSARLKPIAWTPVP
jgi:hypothetical protein